MKKTGQFFIVLFLFLSVSLFSFAPAEAYVSVKGYYKSNGTYVQPHVRSNPNGLKYDNYSYTPSQGLYNKTYGTRGTSWDTPTYITDSSYYVGKSLYDNKQSLLSVSSGTSQYPSLNNTISLPANASLDYYGTGWLCKTGYKNKFDAKANRVGCEKK